jgi:hypothetical protein
VLAEESTDLIHQGGEGLDEPHPHPMEDLKILLLHLLDRDKTHGWPGPGLTDGFGITAVALRRLDIRFHEWWGAQPHVMAMLTKPPSPVVGTPTGFHANKGRRQGRDQEPQLTTGYTPPESDVSAGIHADDVKHSFRDVDAEDS